MTTDCAGRQEGECSPWCTHRLWSLWDMQPFEANTFVFLSRELGRLSALLEKPDDLLGEWRTDDHKTNDATVIGSYKGQFASLGLGMCAAQVDRIVFQCQTNQYLTHTEMARLVHELAVRMEDECKLNHYLSVTAEEKSLIEPASPLFGVDVEDKLPAVIEDISEAGKCLVDKI